MHYAGMSDVARHAKEAMEIVGLAERIITSPTNYPVASGSGVAIARALVNNPAMVLADEPTGAGQPHR